MPTLFGVPELFLIRPTPRPPVPAMNRFANRGSDRVWLPGLSWFIRGPPWSTPWKNNCAFGNSIKLGLAGATSHPQTYINHKTFWQRLVGRNMKKRSTLPVEYCQAQNMHEFPKCCGHVKHPPGWQCNLETVEKSGNLGKFDVKMLGGNSIKFAIYME